MFDENGAHSSFPLSDEYNGVCTNCGELTQLNPETGWCFECSPVITVVSRTEISLAANANAVEHLINNGAANNVWQALRIATSDRPTCIVCGERIRRSQRHAIFCRQTKRCRRYSRRYVYLYREKGLSKVEALAVVFGELTSD